MAVDSAEPVEQAAAPHAQPAPPAATSDAAAQPATSEAAISAPDANDTTSAIVTDARKKLGEIDQLLKDTAQ